MATAKALDTWLSKYETAVHRTNGYVDRLHHDLETLPTHGARPRRKKR